MPDRLDVDVCVVGAGYAGLTAAWRLHQAGRSVAVLEARDRVGGRIWTTTLADGTAVDRGGAWLAPYHDVMFGLAAEFGVSTYRTYVAGAHLLIGKEKTHRYTGLIPKISLWAILTLVRANRRIDKMARTVPVEAPWTAERADEWDQQTVADWMARSGVKHPLARDLFDSAVRGLFTGDLADVSLLDLFFLAHAHGSIENLFSIEGGGQETLVDGGAGAIAARMADALGDAVHLDAPVRSITQGDDGVVIEADGLTVAGQSAIITVPPALALDIAFDPVLPEGRVALYRAAVAGPETKTLLVYDEPFWRAEGFSGQTAEPQSVAEVTIDASPVAGNAGVLASFTFGPVAERFDAMDGDERRRLLLDAMAARLGPRAAEPVEVIETPWAEQEWTRGCSMAHFPPGALTRYGHLLREPVGRLHWAGTETSTVSHGAMDGAARSGERAAVEVLALS